MALIIIKNNTTSFHRIALSGEFDDDLDLAPGINEVDDGQWARAAVDSMIRWRVENDEYLVLGKCDERTTPLAKLKDKNAVAMVKATVTEALLKRWQPIEKRPTVAAAIAEQLIAIDPATKVEKKPAAPPKGQRGYVEQLEPLA